MSSPVGYPQRNAYPMFSSTSQGDVPVGKNGANLIPVMANVTSSSRGGVITAGDKTLHFAPGVHLVGTGYDPVTNTGEDCTDKLVAANALALLEDVPLYLSGTFVVDDGWAIPSGSTVIGLNRPKIYRAVGRVTPKIKGSCVVQVGTGSVAASNVKVHGLDVYPQRSLSGGAIYGIGPHLDVTPTAYAENIEIRQCYVNDATIGILVAKDGYFPSMLDAGRVSSRFKNVAVRECVVTGTSNKAIEIGECVDSVIERNLIYACVDGAQFIGNCARCSISENIINVTNGAIQVAHQADDIKINGNHVTSSVNFSAGIMIRAEPQAQAITMSKITIADNTINLTVGSGCFGLLIQSRAENTSFAVTDVFLENNHFFGNAKVYLGDKGTKAASCAISNLSLRGGYAVSIDATPAAPMSSVSKLVVAGATIGALTIGSTTRSVTFSKNYISGAVTVPSGADNISMIGNEISGAYTIAAGATNTRTAGNVAASYSDSGTGTTSLVAA